MNFRRLFHKKKSKDIARDRLKILLISDRVNCSPEIMELIKNDIARVLSKYMTIDSDHMEIQINAKSGKNGRNAKPSLYANIPIVDVTSQDLASNR